MSPTNKPVYVDSDSQTSASSAEDVDSDSEGLYATSDEDIDDDAFDDDAFEREAMAIITQRKIQGAYPNCPVQATTTM